MIIKSKKVPKSKSNGNAVDDLIARFCYHFPQYTYLEAKTLPYKRIIQMLKIQRKEEARMMYQLCQIVIAPHTKNGHKDILKYYKDIISG